MTATRHYRPPKAYAKWIFMLTNADRITDPEDRATLSEMASRKLALRTPT